MNVNTDSATETPRPNGSTGPRTAEGKARSCLNSLVHGLNAKDVIVTTDEEREEFEQTKIMLYQQIQPDGAVQMMAFNDLLHAFWNKARIQRMEAEYLSQGPELLGKPETRKTLELLHRYFVRHERSYVRARKEIEHLQTSQIVRGTIPEQVQEVIPPMANPMKINLAKRTADKAWPVEEIITIKRVTPDAEPTNAPPRV